MLRDSFSDLSRRVILLKMNEKQPDLLKVSISETEQRKGNFIEKKRKANRFSLVTFQASQLKFIYFACANRILLINEVSVQIWKRKRLRFLLSIVMDVGDGILMIFVWGPVDITKMKKETAMMQTFPTVSL